MSKEKSQLEELRDRIDALDEEILKLLNERAQCALDVADVKLKDFKTMCLNLIPTLNLIINF